MRIAATISRYLLGLMFLVFGLNGFFHFLPQPPPSSALAGQFFGVMMGSHYMVPVFPGPGDWRSAATRKPVRTSCLDSVGPCACERTDIPHHDGSRRCRSRHTCHSFMGNRFHECPDSLRWDFPGEANTFLGFPSGISLVCSQSLTSQLS